MLSTAAMPRRAMPCACWIPRASFWESRITVRLRRSRCACSPTRPEIIDRAFFHERLAAALAHRERVVQNSDAYRLVFSEGDLLPGLIVDRYGPYLAMQTLNQGMDRARDVIVDCLQELLAPAGILARNDASVRKLEGLPLEVVTLAGEIPERVHIRMNGLQLEADLLHGQKTGVYLDQRENYLAAGRWARGRVLDCFTSSGGFALHAAAQAESVEAVDSSAGALATAEANAKANGIGNVHFPPGRCFRVSLRSRAQVFDGGAGSSGVCQIAARGGGRRARLQRH